MKTIDIVMPQGGSRGGVEYVINKWTKSLISTKYNLRVFHILPGTEDYLEGYSKQWTMAMPKSGEIKLDIDYCVENYAWFIKNYGAPDICIATWIPMMTSACCAVRTLLGLKFKIISWIHSGIEVYKQLGWGGIEHLGYADYHFCISEKTKTDIKSIYPHAKAFVIGNPVDHVRIEGEYKPDTRTLCFVGRLEAEKRVDVILKGISKAKDKSWRLLIAGDGSLMSEMKDLTNILDISERVCFLGWMSDPWKEVSKASIMLVASDYEGFCITAHEASDIGMTVISTPVNGCTDYIIPGKNGYFFDNNDPQNLADILDYISDGCLPICRPDICTSSASRFLPENYFELVDRNLQSIIDENIL